MTAEMDDRDWGVLLRAIRSGNCVLLLGTEVADAEGTSAESRLAGELALELERPPLDTTKLALVAQQFVAELDRDELETEVDRWYREMAPQSSLASPLRRLAELPFPLIITTRHDRLLEDALIEAGREPLVDHYHFHGVGKDYVEEGSTARPLLYSLHGHLDDVGSLVLTEDDLLDFLAAVLGKNPALPANIRSELSNPRRSFLFLGFGLHHWPLRILLHALRGSGAERRSFAMEEFRDATPRDVEEAVWFWGRGHKIHLFAQEVGAFIEQLHARWSADGGATARTGEHGKASGDDVPSVFLSYASEDLEKVTWLRDGLRARGIAPWHDKEGIYGGDAWEKVLPDAVRSTDYFVLCQSKALSSRAFTWVNTEIDYARKRQTQAAERVRYILPVLLDDAPPLESVSDIQSMKVQADDDIDRLAKIIKRDFARRKRL